MPHLKRNYFLNFYGGEPLLCIDLIKQTVSFLNKENKKLNKKASYSITTNGSLLSGESIQFLNEHRFSVVLSFDGYAQEEQREKGSLEIIVPIIKELLNQPRINLEINSVFSPDTVGHLSKSIQFLMDLGALNIHFSLNAMEPWNPASLQRLENELKKLRKKLLIHNKRKKSIPVINFREDPKKGIFFCTAGKDRLVLTPEEEIWGCFLFPDYFKEKERSPDYSKFFFGKLGNFIKDYEAQYPHISTNYAWLSMDNFATADMKCLMCPDLENCTVCPINAAFSGLPLGLIPDHICRIQKMMSKEKRKFKEEKKSF